MARAGELRPAWSSCSFPWHAFPFATSWVRWPRANERSLPVCWQDFVATTGSHGPGVLELSVVPANQPTARLFCHPPLSQARLRTVKRLGPKDRLVEWRPSDPRQRRRLAESIRLHVIDYQDQGVSSHGHRHQCPRSARIPREAWIRLATKEDEGRLRLAQGLYHRRWEIETTYYELKVTQGMETSLRSRIRRALPTRLRGTYCSTSWCGG